MTDPTTVDLTLADLAISPLNVRLDEKDANAVEALSASIVAIGLQQPLIVHPAPDDVDWAKRKPDAEKFGQVEPASFGVLAGGRRYRAIRLAVGAGHLPVDTPIRCSIQDLSETQIVLLSLSENLLRRDLQPYEVHAAIARLRACEPPMSFEEMAAHLGQSLSWIRQQARLGDLHPPIFEAYCQGALSVEQARAFAATEDTQLQAAAWDHFSRQHEFAREPASIRAFYKVGDHQLARQLAFVGSDTYREAGGRFERDLFAAEEQYRGRVLDEGLLAGLADAKFKLTRVAIREAAGWRDLAFVAEPPKRQGYTDTGLEIFIDGPEGLTAAVPEATPDSAIVVTLEIVSTGKLVSRFWWASRKAKSDAERGKSPSQKGKTLAETFGDDTVYEGSGLDNTMDQKAREVARDEHGLTTTGLDIVRSQRRDLLRSILLIDAGNGGNLARDYLTFALLRHELVNDSKAQLGLPPLAKSWRQGEDQPKADVAPYTDNQIAGLNWKGAVENLLSRDFLVIGDVTEAFRAFVASPESVKADAAAVVTGLMLLRSCNLPGYRVSIHDTLAELAGADPAQLRRLWEPDLHFCGLFPKMKRLELAQPFVDPAAFKSWSSHDDKTLSSACAHVLAEDKHWIHPALSFDFEAFEGAKAETRELEAAE